MQSQPGRVVAILEALVVTVIWASSYVLAKMAMAHTGPLTASGLRYFLAGILLLPFAVRRREAGASRSKRALGKLALMGLWSFTLANGATFWGLQYISAATAQLIMSLAPLPILLAGAVFLKELPTAREGAGTVISLVGCVLFFSTRLEPAGWMGVGLTTVGVGGLVLFTLLGRQMARNREVDTTSLTAVPLFVGGFFLLGFAILVEGWPVLPPVAWAIVLWMAAVNSALASYLYNHALQTLTALELNTVVNLSPLGTAILGWVLLDERLEVIQVVGMVFAVVGVGLVQWRGQKSTGQNRAGDAPKRGQGGPTNRHVPQERVEATWQELSDEQ